jgi:hypothetical protein
MSAASSTRAPRAVLIRIAPARINPRRRASMRPRVWPTSATCKLTASDLARSVSSSAGFAGTPAGIPDRFQAMTRMPTADATHPHHPPPHHPTTPKVRPASSRPSLAAQRPA